MKNTIRFTAAVCLAAALAVCGCSSVGDSVSDSSHSEQYSSSSSDSSVETTFVRALQAEVTIKESKVKSYDYASLFEITDNGAVIDASRYADSSAVKEIAGKYEVTCSYDGKTASVTVTVTASEYALELSVAEISVSAAQCLNYDYKSLFTAYVDGEKVALTGETVDNGVRAEKGTYTYKITFRGASKTLTVNVTEEHLIEAFCSYAIKEVPIGELGAFDYTSLFSLYVDGEAVRVSTDMLDVSALDSAAIGNEYAVKLTYKAGDSSTEKTARIKVAADGEISITAKNVVTYPNCEFIDTTSLFRINYGGKDVPVTADMISGVVDYTKEGINTITVEYGGKYASAQVEIKKGVMISAAKSDAVTVRINSDKSAYRFSDDFKVLINGLRFKNVERYVDSSAVDFSKTGICEAEISIPYSVKQLGISTPPEFVYYDFTIRYVVVDNEYFTKVISDEVHLECGVSTYNAFSNLSVTVNGKKQTLTSNAEYADSITCYALIVSAPLDFSKTDVPQTVSVNLYVNGADAKPINVSFMVIIDSGAEIKAKDKVVFEGETVYVRDLFTITENGAPIEVTQDMIEGKADTFVSGTYSIRATYNGAQSQAHVYVIDNSIKGKYFTAMTTIPVYSYEDLYDETTGESTSVEVMHPGTRLKNMFIDAVDDMKVNGIAAKITGLTEDGAVRFAIGNNAFTLYANDGVAVIVPDNQARMPFGETRRPVAYFKTDVWQVQSAFVVNSLSRYVLAGSSSGFSADLCKIEKNDGSEKKWFALKVALTEKSSSDTVYEVDFGDATVADDFSMQSGADSSFVFAGKTYCFYVTDDGFGKIKNKDTARKYAGMSFNGKVDGSDAVLVADQYEGFSLYVGGNKIFALGSLEMDGMPGCYRDYANNAVFICNSGDKGTAAYAYKFMLNVADKTFTVAESDGFYGKYVCDDKYLFLDGYGTGIARFSSEGFYYTCLSYAVNGPAVSVRYLETKASFEYGVGAEFYIHPFKNILTVDKFTGAELKGKKFVNQYVTDGAIVNVDSFEIGSDITSKSAFLSNISIVTASGELDTSAKSACVDTKKIKFKTPGFYEFSVTVSDGGKQVSAYYAAQVLEDVYKDSAICADYGGGVIYPANSLSADKYGRLSVTAGGIVYRGTYKIASADGFVGKAFSPSGSELSVSGISLADGVIIAKFTGAAAYSDYYSTREVYSFGCKGFSLRAFVSQTDRLFVLSQAKGITGEKVTVVSDNGIDVLTVGSIIKVTESGGKIHYAKILSLSDIDNGLVLADSLRGKYSGSDGDITLDGFGGIATKDGLGAYTAEAGVVTAEIGKTVKIYRVNATDGSYEKIAVAIDETLVRGKTYAATYSFVCGSFTYDADTKFIFGADGEVTVVSVSDSHDLGDGMTEACENDKYAPAFASKSGIKGKYSVVGNRVAVTVNGISFSFVIQNVLKPDSLVCESTSISSGHGYFKTGTAFSAVK